jgi:hypothetical protein
VSFVAITLSVASERVFVVVVVVVVVVDLFTTQYGNFCMAYYLKPTDMISCN